MDCVQWEELRRGAAFRSHLHTTSVCGKWISIEWAWEWPYEFLHYSSSTRWRKSHWVDGCERECTHWLYLFRMLYGFPSHFVGAFGTTANAKRNNFTAIHTNKLASEWKANKNGKKCIERKWAASGPQNCHIFINALVWLWLFVCLVLKPCFFGYQVIHQALWSKATWGILSG